MTASGLVIEGLEKRDGFGREVFLTSLEDFVARPSLVLPSNNFVCLVAGDSSGRSGSELKEFGAWLLEQGAVYICAWGPSCEDLEEAVDYAVVDADIESGTESAVVITTSHAQESLEDALEYFWSDANPHPWYGARCKAALAMAIGNPKWKGEISSWVRNRH